MALFTNKYPYTDFHELNLDWIIEQVQTVTELVNDINKRAVTKGYLEQQLALYNSNLSIQINANRKYIDDEVERLNYSMAELNAAIDVLYKVMLDHQKLIDSQIQQMYIDLLKYIDEHIATITQLYVKSPITGKLTDIQTVLDDIWNRLLAIGALTATEYDNLELTANAYDYQFIQAIQYDSGGKWIFFPRLYQTITSPFDGKKTYIKEVIYQLADLHKEGITAEAYDERNIEANVYDSIRISAYTYDWHGI